jgi:cysteine-rich repeat protein
MPYCGDGIVDEELGEACDDGNADNTDGCTDTCELPACGDGYVQEGEECDDGNAVDDDGCTNECLLGYCGNGILEPGEQCDDGNADDGDGCSSACAMEWAVFVTSVGFKGDLGGIAGADEKCQAHADSDTSLAPAGKYLAWLSDETDESSPQARFPTGDPELDGAYKLVDGTLVATDWADLTDGEITSPIILDETGASVPNESVWSNTTALGERKGDNHCQSWSTVSGMSRGFLGLSSESSSQWSDLDDFGNTCNSQYRLYCVQVPEG